MPRAHPADLTHDAVTLSLAGLLLGVGTVFAVVSGFHPVKIVVYLVVAGLILLAAAYIREREPGEPPDEHQ